MGTLPYMPPEQAIDVRTSKPTADVFSMGATLYQMLSGRTIRDFSAVLNDAIRQVISEPPIRMRKRHPAVPGLLAAVVDRSLKMNPAERFSNAMEFREALWSAIQ